MYPDAPGTAVIVFGKCLGTATCLPVSQPKC